MLHMQGSSITSHRVNTDVVQHGGAAMLAWLQLLSTMSMHGVYMTMTSHVC